ncbi:MAG: TOBE domain-containing protein, partial [Deltaproteobacteria bacterium]|nr:TOBE domain-containing protein [Deltaproteobacteria bacterium]
SENYAASNVVEVVAEVITFLGAVVQVTFTLEGEEMLVDITENAFEKIGLQRGDAITLYFPPDAFHGYTELFKKII